MSVPDRLFNPLSVLAYFTEHMKRKQITLNFHVTNCLIIPFFLIFQRQWWLGVVSSPVQLWTKGLVSAKRDSPAHKDTLTVTLITINFALLFCV